MAVHAKMEGTPRSIAFTCSYVPEEIIMASGMRPSRMIPEARRCEVGTYLHPNTCGYIKSLLASLVADGAQQPAGLVFANSCDGMRRLADICRARLGTVPQFFIEVPKKKDPDSVGFFASELRRFQAALESRYAGVKITDDGLRSAIRECNNVRRLMREVFRLQRDPNSSVRGSSVFNLCLEGTRSDAASFAEDLRGFVAESERAEGSVSGKPPSVVLTGNSIHRPDLVKLIEDSGGRVVSLDTCLVGRHQDRLVDESAPDPLRALAERYLGRAACARMEGIDGRLQYLKGLVVDCGADAVIYCVTKFCDGHTYDVPTLQEEFREAGIPFLLVENDYEWAGLEQTRTRMEGLFEMLSERRSRQNV